MPTAAQLANIVISGTLTGTVYGLMALGLSAIFGVIRLVNFAHGELMSVAFITPDIPRTWDSGAAASCTSSAVSAKASASARAFQAMPPWVSSAAFA